MIKLEALALVLLACLREFFRYENRALEQFPPSFYHMPLVVTPAAQLGALMFYVCSNGNFRRNQMHTTSIQRGIGAAIGRTVNGCGGRMSEQPSLPPSTTKCTFAPFQSVR